MDRDTLDGRTARRRAPGEPLYVVVPFGGIGHLPERGDTDDVELTIEATNADQELAVWCEDDWWTDVIVRWADCRVTVRFSPTPGALLHPVILYQLEMLRRVTPNWRLIGYGYRDDVTSFNDVAAIARSWYHEVRFIDQPRPGLVAADRFGSAARLDELFGRVRRAQVDVGMTTPILVRLAGALGGGVPTQAEPTERAVQAVAPEC